MDYTSLDDPTLLGLIVQGQQEALSALYDRYGRLVFSLAIHTVGDQAMAEEITQDVFFRVWEKAATYRVEQAKVTTWLTTITRNRSIDGLRQRGVRPEGNSVGWDDLLAGARPATEDSPETAAERALAGQRVRAAMDTLPADQRAALHLAFFLGLSHSEVAERLGEPLGTVKTRIRLAMQKLRSLLQDEPSITQPRS